MAASMSTSCSADRGAEPAASGGPQEGENRSTEAAETQDHAADQRAVQELATVHADLVGVGRNEGGGRGRLAHRHQVATLAGQLGGALHLATGGALEQGVGLAALAVPGARLTGEVAGGAAGLTAA
jgi:hypothetical protein